MTARRFRFVPRDRQLLLGVAAAATVALLLVGSTVLAAIRPGDTTIRAEFAQAAGLRAGASVDVSGIEVGQVRAIRLVGDRVLADLRVRPDLRFGPDARAVVKLSTVLGRMHVELTPGDGSGLPDDTIRLDRTEVPYNLAKVVRDPQYRNSFEHIERIDPQRLREALDQVNRQLGDSPQLAVQALDSIGSLARVINDRRDQVESLLADLDTVSALAADNRSSVLVLLTRGEAIGAAVQQRQAALRGLLDNVAALSKLLQDIGLENQDQLAPLIRNLNTMSEGLTKNDRNLAQLYQVMPVAVRQLANTYGNGPYGDVWAPWLFPDNWLCFAHAVAGCN